MENILLIGLGYHARRIYFPILKELQQKKVIHKIFIVDLESQRDTINNYILENGNKKVEVFFLEKAQNNQLSREIDSKLNQILVTNNIKGVIISTEPLAHMVYAKWAIEKGLSVLMDKPISTYESIISNEMYGRKLQLDYKELSTKYEKTRKKNPQMVFALMAQRRYHPLFNKIKNSIGEIYKQTNCPITSIQAFHCDGQWRFPAEIIDQNYHPYNQGYGVCSHSGYHIYDIVSWLMRGSDKEPDEMEVFSNFSTPIDIVEQYGFKDYERDFPDFNKYNNYSLKDFIKKTKKFGEVDCFSNFVFKKRNRAITLVDINMQHNGFSQRNWVSASNRDLYKGNGRVRQESYQISQGPFQSIKYLSYQSKEVDPNLEKDIFKFGGEYHAEVYIFRNSSFNHKWKCIEHFDVKDLMSRRMKDKSRGHQEDARREAVIAFVNNLIDGDRRICDFLDLPQHERSVKMVSGIYRSMARRKKGQDPLVKIKL